MYIHVQTRTHGVENEHHNIKQKTVDQINQKHLKSECMWRGEGDV